MGYAAFHSLGILRGRTVASVGDSITAVVAPQAGPMLAGACARAAATNAGKSIAELSMADWAHVEQAVRGLLAPIAPGHTIEQLLMRIKECT